MRLSRYFLPILKETPKEAEIVSHRLMLRAGMIRQEAAGSYAWLPLGVRVLHKICAIIREEQNRAGAIEVLMPTIQSADLWRESGRYDDYGKEMLRIRDRHDRDMLYGPTNEEMITEIFRASVRSYKDLPLNLYHIQWKFRDEVRPRFGVMRSREFLMKDAYTFDLDLAGARHSYNKSSPPICAPSPGSASPPSRCAPNPARSAATFRHEFIILASTGESEVFCHRDYLSFQDPARGHRLRQRRDHAGGGRQVDLALRRDLRQARCGGVREARSQGPRFPPAASRSAIFSTSGPSIRLPMKAVVNGPDGKEHFVHMGSYGIGPTRLAAALIEANHDENGPIWPEAAAPFRVGLINLKVGDAACDGACARIYAALDKAGVDVLYDDRDERPGAKFATMDLVGAPRQVIVGPKSLAEGKVELKTRRGGERELISVDAAIAKLGGTGVMRGGPSLGRRFARGEAIRHAKGWR